MKILDEGKLKYCSEVQMVKKWYETDSLYFVFSRSDAKTKEISDIDEDLYEYQKTVSNEYYIEPTRKFMAWKKKCFEESFSGDLVPKGYFAPFDDPYKNVALKYWNEKEILDYLKIIPFTPSAMINISPDWKSVEKRTNCNKVKILKLIIENYLKEQWFDKWSYVIENGSEGDHIHAHLVGHMNVSRLKSCESHLARGNQTQQLKKHANKIKGMQGLIKGVSVQKCILRNEQLVKDKLDYLIEEHKPVGHKNKSIIPDGFMTGSLFTVK